MVSWFKTMVSLGSRRVQWMVDEINVEGGPCVRWCGPLCFEVNKLELIGPFRSSPDCKVWVRPVLILLKVSKESLSLSSFSLVIPCLSSNSSTFPFVSVKVYPSITVRSITWLAAWWDRHVKCLVETYMIETRDTLVILPSFSLNSNMQLLW